MITFMSINVVLTTHEWSKRKKVNMFNHHNIFGSRKGSAIIRIYNYKLMIIRKLYGYDI